MSVFDLMISIMFFLFLIKVIRDSLYFLWLFQIKEYRLDRFRSYLKEGRQTRGVGNELEIQTKAKGNKLVIFIISILLLIILATTEFISYIFFNFWLIAPLYFAIAFIKIIIEVKARTIKRPKATNKIILVSVIFIFFYTLFIYGLYGLFRLLPYHPVSLLIIPIFMVIASIISPIIITLAIAIVTPFSNWQKKKVIKAATEKRRSLKHVRTIGITGSYGKTSTKEFLYTILSQKYKVVKTEGNNNTAMGVAGTVLNKVSDDFDFFICEMGAYKIGEIKEICEIAQPEIGIITGINEQHIELFGSIENTKKAKFELLESLPETGIAAINKNTLEMKPKVKFRAQNIFLFSKELAQNTSVTPDYVEFQYKEASFKLNALGEHYIGNLMATIIVAEQLGMSLSEISAAISKIEIKGRYLMQKISGPKNAVFIDDSYSANPDGVIASLEYIETAYPDYKKIFVFPGIIELGKKSEEIHQRIWRKVNESFHTAYIIQKNDRDIQKKYTKCHFVFEKNFDKISQEVDNEIEEKTVVLFESRGAGVVMQKILNKK